TAAEPATSPTAPPATTTWATSWIVDPAYTPNACSPSPTYGYSHGYRNIPVVPNTTTVATATDTLCACARTTGSVAITAAAPQIALPAPISIAVSRSSLNTRVPSSTARPNTEPTMVAAISTPSTPTPAMPWNVTRKPESTMPARSTMPLAKSTPAPLPAAMRGKT